MHQQPVLLLFLLGLKFLFLIGGLGCTGISSLIGNGRSDSSFCACIAIDAVVVIFAGIYAVRAMDEGCTIVI